MSEKFSLLVYSKGKFDEEAFKEIEKIFEQQCLERAYEVHDPLMPYIVTGGYPYYPLYDNPRFLAILEEMNLPIPDTSGS